MHLEHDDDSLPANWEDCIYIELLLNKNLHRNQKKKTLKKVQRCQSRARHCDANGQTMLLIKQQTKDDKKTLFRCEAQNLLTVLLHS